VDELLLLQPDSVALHQKRVEVAVRSGDRPMLVEAYVALGECLVRAGQPDRARSVFGRVLELAPTDARARAGFDTIRAMISGSMPAVSGGMPAITGGGRAVPGSTFPRFDLPSGTFAPAAADAGYVDLGDWLREDEEPRSTRMVAAGVVDPEEAEQVDFAEMLERFKQGIAANVEETDHQSHYDLGCAYRDMGLLDEAIPEFQKALRTSGNRLRTYEALGQCFVDKGQHAIAVALLSGAVAERGLGDDTMIGVLYLLGVASEALRRRDEARGYYERVFAVDVGFADVARRLQAVEQVGA
jgi:tetratricopeptide (TPR) repeat protein